MHLRTIPTLLSEYLSRGEAAVTRHWAPYTRKLVIAGADLLPDPAERAEQDFDRRLIPARYQRGVEIEGRLYNYVLYPGTGDVLCVHFSAFFGDWGDRRAWRSQFQGYFHRLKMFWPLVDHSFLFLCDTFGADRNGTYYKGERGDYFVERAMDGIIHDVRAELDAPPERVITAGSSMGATAALRFALRHRLRGSIAVSPHIDLDVSARYQCRQRHVAAIVGRDDLDAPELRPVMREVTDLAGSVAPATRIVMQSMRDDHGVHYEQVEPFVELWRSRGGAIWLDEHATGGHTSEYATPEFFARGIDWCLGERPAPTSDPHEAWAG